MVAPIRAKPADWGGLDYSAYLIGRMSIAWGLIEQRIYSDISRFESRKSPARHIHEIEIDERFEHRRKQWRKLLKDGCGNDKKTMSALDRAITEMDRLSLIRHHIAHGYPVYMELGVQEPCIHIFEHRETTKRIKAAIVLAARNPGKQLTASPHPTYTLRELEKAVRGLEDLDSKILAVSDAVFRNGKL